MNVPHAHLFFSIAELKVLREDDLASGIAPSAIVAGEGATRTTAEILKHAPRAAVPIEVPIQLEVRVRPAEIFELKRAAARKRGGDQQHKGDVEWPQA
jgi:hypothetical protein